MTNFPSYPKVLAIGHREILDIFDGEVYVQEKIDGSQINFTWSADGRLHVRSKGQWQYGGPENKVTPDKMFNLPIEYLKELTPQREGVIFRGEMITKPKQNVIVYERVPEGYIVLFDVLDVGWNLLPHEPYDLPFEFVQPDGPFDGKSITAEVLQDYVTRRTPMLGGEQVEGAVVKNYNKFTADGKIMVGKYVTDAFKEKHNKDWKENNPGKRDILYRIIGALNTDARAQKAVQHLMEEGKLQGTPQDIGPLIKEMKRDVLDEERDWIIEELVKAFLPEIERKVGHNVPVYYKKLLLEQAVGV